MPEQYSEATSAHAFPHTAAGSADHGRAGAFGVTGFDVIAMSKAARQPGLGASPSPFDVCHVGVVSRALLFVHGVVAIGTAFAAPTLAAWAQLFALASLVTLPAILLWLIVACLCKKPLARLSVPAQRLAALVLGGICGAAGWSQLWLSGLATPMAGSGPHAAMNFGLGASSGAASWIAPVLAGMAMAGAIFQWLRLRALTQLPADTSARLAELQSRIRPHFLFNTLNTAIALARVDPARTEEILEDLAELFRVALSDNGASVTLAEEVELAKRYLAIEQIRFGARLTVDWQLDDAAGLARVPPLLLQPLVENAVRHGVEPSDDGGSIRVRTRVRRDQAIISIVNTVPRGRHRPGNGMALANVRERLRLMHDVSAQFDAELDSEADVYRVQIVVPL